MRQATINISKIASKIEGASVVTAKLSDLASLIEGLDVFEFKGTCKSAKVAKYASVIEGCGFELSQTVRNESAGFEEHPDVVEFSFVYIKK